MSKDFIKDQINASSIEKARRQQKQLSYFTQSCVQEDVTQAYIKQWAERNYRGSDYFLNWVKMVLRSENFMTFYKFLRHPLPSAKLINDEIIPQLKRVYYSDDSYFKYAIKNKPTEVPEELENKEFENKLFNSICFNYNDIIVHDLEDTNKPYRYIVSIENVVAVKSKNNIIKKLAFTAEIHDDNGEDIHGYLYIDDEKYEFFDKEFNSIKTVTHDLGRCPATWIANESFSNGKDEVVRKSIFSYVREEVEEYVFLKTLRKMSEPNGAIPITVRLKGGAAKAKDGNDIGGVNDAQPMTPNLISSQQARTGKEVQATDSVLQTGTVVSVPLSKKNDGSIDTDMVQNFLKMYYIPVECLEFIDGRIKELEHSIISNALGDYSQANDASKNEYQVYSALTNRQDKLRALSQNMSWTRNNSDRMLLGLKYGIDNVNVSCFYGSDFFLDTEKELYDKFEKAPNQIERRNVIKRLGQTKYRFNPERAERENLLYSLMPYISDKDFETALNQRIVDYVTKQYQTRFDYWISLFEANYGDILNFYVNLEATESEKLIVINNLIINLIPKENENKE